MTLEYVVVIFLISATLLFFLRFNPGLPQQSDIDLQRMKCESPIERRLYHALVRQGYTVKTQVRCEWYRIDIALPAHRIAIECDGKEYHSTLDQKQHDSKKDRVLRANGWSVLRITGSEINGSLVKTLRR